MSTKIGWIDFSDKDKKKALDVLHLMQDGAVDEIGIGLIRDAFANYFFPGTSTVQTRAKYFFIIPYAMKEVCSNTNYNSIEEITKEVDEKERYCAIKMKNNSNSSDGIIGYSVIPNEYVKGRGDWVVRKPSNIYWNGLKKFGIFTYESYSIKDYYREEIRRRAINNKNTGNRSGKESEQDDETATANNMRPFWNLPPEYEEYKKYKKDIFNNLDINLESWEADWLSKCISTNIGDSLFCYILKNNIKLNDFLDEKDSFRALSEHLYGKVNDELKGMLILANKFNSLAHLCFVLYNIILSDGKNEKANRYWEETRENRLADIKDLDIDELFCKTNVNSYKLKLFLEDMKKYLLEDNIKIAKLRIIDREIQLKTTKRAKLLRKSDFAPNQWVGSEILDFRLTPAARIINDIYEAKNNNAEQ